MWENTVAIHSISKEKNYKTKFLSSSILKSKIDKDNFRKKNKKKREKKCEKKEKKKEKMTKKQKKNYKLLL